VYRTRGLPPGSSGMLGKAVSSGICLHDRTTMTGADGMATSTCGDLVQLAQSLMHTVLAFGLK